MSINNLKGKLQRKFNVLILYLMGMLTSYPENNNFPDPEKALKNPEGLVSVGGKLTSEKIIESYSSGIFPYYYKKPIKWWSPNPRMALLPKDLKIQQGLRRTVKKKKFAVTFDTAFKEVMESCADRDITWITPETIWVWCELHKQGYAHSVEVWSEKNELIGGLYGLALGKFFSTESLFHTKSNMSKVAFMYLNCHLQHWGFVLNDLQFVTDHWKDQGCTAFPRNEYIKKLKIAVTLESKMGSWTIDESLNVADWEPSVPGSQIPA